MDKTKIRESFKRIREDMNFFFKELQQIKANLEELKQELKTPTPNTQNSNTPTHFPTLQHSQEALKSQNKPISTGNEGVPTLHPTLHPTIQHPPISTEEFALNKPLPEPEKDRISQLKRASEILSSLDELKREVRFKFKKLTQKEMLIFSTIYQLEELGVPVTYDIVAEKLNLTEISIRDYVRKIIKKGIPLEKRKENNQRTILKIPQELRKIASLNTILQLREL